LRRGIEIDWVVVRVNTIRRAIALGATGLVAAGLLGFAYVRLHPKPRDVARTAIQRAEKDLREARAREVPLTWKRELHEAAGQLDEARKAYGAEHWEQATSLARAADQRFRFFLDMGQDEMVGAGQIISLHGKVDLQRAGKNTWTPARERMPVFNGDYVRTGADGAAEILFADGTLYRVAPDSLLEIHSPAQKEKPAKVTMVVGRLNVYTSSSSSTVTTDAAETHVAEESRVAVNVNRTDHRTMVAAYAGTAQVRSRSGAKVLLMRQDAVTALADGSLGEKRQIPDPPTLLAPENNAAVDLDRSPVLTLRWRLPQRAVGSHLQVSRSRRFYPGSVDIDAKNLRRPRARIKGLLPGTYFWRVAAIDAEGAQSDWSSVRRFRFSHGTRALPMEDHTPPDLEVQPARQMGQLFIVEGQTEPGATVTINGESVDVDANGHFRKAVEAHAAGWNDLVVAAVDPAGNRTERRQRVYVEVY
jgi:hypothetical protein